MEISQIGIYDAIGIVGVVLYVSSYFLVQMKCIDGNRSVYTIMNLLAASAVLVSLMHSFNLASALIQISWITISLIGIMIRTVTQVKQKRMLRQLHDGNDVAMKV